MPASRILVVEDESIVALHLSQQLRKLGYEVPAAVATGNQALCEIESSRPDLVLMDINLKGQLDGIATAALIPSEYRIPVIYLTAYTEEATLARAGTTNPYGYLLKPFSEREVHAMIQVALARSRAEHASHAELECRKRAEKMAALGQLAAGVAVEFNDLLTAIYGQLEVLGHHAIEHPGIATPVDDAFDAAIEKEKLVQRLLAFSGQQKLAPRLVPVTALISNVSNNLRAIVGRSIRLQIRVPEELWSAWIDAGKFAGILANLAMNAREAMPNGGNLTIEARNTVLDQGRAGADAASVGNRYVHLAISDTGSGMAGHVIDRAFEPFFTTKPAGGGLGLSLAFGFVRQSGGHISIDSTPGAGTTVRLFIPAAPEDNIAQAAALAGAETEERLIAASRTAPSEPLSRYPVNDDVETDWPAAADASDEWPVSWSKAEDALFASTLPDFSGVSYRLIVEPLPMKNEWDWTVWRPGDRHEMCRYGRASSVEIAMAAAEAAARLWAGNGPSV